MNTDTAIILAAGLGSRLQAQEGHKLLANLAGRPLLSHHLENFQRLQVSRILIVTGHRHLDLEEAIRAFPAPEGVALQTVHNQDYRASNGISVLAAVDALYEESPGAPFWLTMSDHLFDPALFDDLSRGFHREKSPSWGGALMIDKKLDVVFDMPDATKVRTSPEDFQISKELDRFDAVDAGLFWCAEPFVAALRAERELRGDCSTSDAVRRLQKEGRFGFWDIGPFLWQDVDTPGARAHAEKLLAETF